MNDLCSQMDMSPIEKSKYTSKLFSFKMVSGNLGQGHG